MTWCYWKELKGPAVDTSLQNKVGELKRAINRLKLLCSHDTLVLLRNSLAMHKLLYTLRTSRCADNRILPYFDETLKSGIITILNVDISNDQWLQASLPVRNGGLEIRSGEMLAPSASFGLCCIYTPTPEWNFTCIRDLEVVDKTEKFSSWTKQRSHFNYFGPYRKSGM